MKSIAFQLADDAAQQLATWFLDATLKPTGKAIVHPAPAKNELADITELEVMVWPASPGRTVTALTRRANKIDYTLGVVVLDRLPGGDPTVRVDELSALCEEIQNRLHGMQLLAGRSVYESDHSPLYDHKSVHDGVFAGRITLKVLSHESFGQS